MASGDEASKRLGIAPPVSFYYVRHTVVSIDSTAVQILRPDPKRVAILLPSYGSNSYYVWPENQGTSLHGFAVPIDSNGLILDWNRIAVAINGEWWGIKAPGAFDINIAEVLAV